MRHIYFAGHWQDIDLRSYYLLIVKDINILYEIVIDQKNRIRSGLSVNLFAFNSQNHISEIQVLTANDGPIFIVFFKCLGSRHVHKEINQYIYMCVCGINKVLCKTGPKPIQKQIQCFVTLS